MRSGGAVFDLDVEIAVSSGVRILREELTAVEGVPYGGRRLAAGRSLLASDPVDPRRSDLNVRYFNGRRGLDPGVPFSADRLLTSQVPVRLPATTEATKLVHRAAQDVLAVLKNVFLLDPVPHLMRQYVNARDTELRRSTDNLSAAVAGLKQADPVASSDSRNWWRECRSIRCGESAASVRGWAMCSWSCVRRDTTVPSTTSRRGS